MSVLTIITGFLGKAASGVAGKAVAGFGRVLSGFWGTFRFYLLAALIAALVAACYLHWRNDTKTADLLAKTQAAYAVTRTINQQLFTALEDNNNALTECRSINRANAQMYAEQERNGLEAAARIAALEALTKRDISDVQKDAETLRSTGLDCPAINADFRHWVRN